MEEPLVRSRPAGAVVTLTLNRPQALNSFTAAMHGELRAALDAAAARPQRPLRRPRPAPAGAFAPARTSPIRRSRRTASGGARRPTSARSIERFYKPLALRIRSMPVPVIAAVNGVAAGAGANFALLCDIVVAARSASFIQAFSKIGLVPDCGGTWLLPRLVGRANAMALAMLGDKLAGRGGRAARPDLEVRRRRARFAAEVEALAARLAAMPTRALVATRAGARRRASSSTSPAR